MEGKWMMSFSTHILTTAGDVRELKFSLIKIFFIFKSSEIRNNSLLNPDKKALTVNITRLGPFMLIPILPFLNPKINRFVNYMWRKKTPDAVGAYITDNSVLPWFKSLSGYLQPLLKIEFWRPGSSDKHDSSLFLMRLDGTPINVSSLNNLLSALHIQTH